MHKSLLLPPLEKQVPQLCKWNIQSQKSWKIITSISNLQKHWCMIWIFWNYLAICLAFINELCINRTVSTTDKPNRPTVNYFRDTTQDPETEHKVQGQIQGQFWYEDASWNLRAVPVNQGHLVTWLHTDICLNRLYDYGPVRWGSAAESTWSEHFYWNFYEVKLFWNSFLVSFV